MMLRFRLLLGLMVIGCSTASGWGGQLDAATTEKEKKITALRIENAIVLDGVLDEPAWQLAEVISDFTQYNPDTGAPPTEPTEVRLLYNDEFLYLGVYCFDSAGVEGIVVTDLRRDFTSSQSDSFNIALDTFNDDRNSFGFVFNARGAKFDFQATNDGGKRNSSWDGIWYVKTQINEAGWQAEMAIPFKTLRFSSDEHQDWGVNFFRRVRRKSEETNWSPIPRPYSASHVSSAGTLEGLSGIQQGRNLYFKPYISAPVVRLEGDDVDFLPDVGFDVKAGLGSQLTLDLTVNTDFSQVEADNQQINLTRFSLFFPEKRDFFLENATTFQFGPGTGGLPGGDFRDLIPFFSRRIGISGGDLVPLLGGARLTGRVGPYSLGLISIQADDAEGIPSTNFSVVRVSRDVLRQSEIGAIFVNKYENGGDFNRTYGADANFTFFRSMHVTSFLLKTSTPSISDQDLAGRFSLDWVSPQLTAQGSYLSIGDNLNPEVGFVPRTGIRKSSGTFAVRPRPKERIPAILEFEPLIRTEYITDQDNNLETRNLEGRFTVRFRNGGSIWLAANSNFERLTEPFPIRGDQNIAVGDYSFNEYTLSLASDQGRLLSGVFAVTTGEFFDGDKDSYAVTGRFRKPQFQAEVSWKHDNVRLTSGDFETDLVSTLLNYSFNTNMFLNALIQYNRDLKEINSNIRYNFIHKPLSDLFLVYNERRSSTGEVVERALIAKLTYVFSF